MYKWQKRGKKEKIEEKARKERKLREAVACVWELVKYIIIAVLFVLLIPLKIALWFLEVSAFGYKEVWKRDELERIMHDIKDDDD